MARPLRIEYPGAVYHVLNRGNRRSRVFHSAWHYRLFLEKLGRFALQFDVRVNSYCLMPNHFHLLLCTREANLSRFMQSLLTSYTVGSNLRDESVGHIFQGRFKAHLVEAQKYLSDVSRYIHLNPLRTAGVHDLDLGQRRAALHGFRWSSLPVVIGLLKTPEWMDIGPVLSTWGHDPDECMRNYRAYVEQGLTVDLPSPFLDLAEQSILGSESFIDTIRRRHLLSRAVRDRSEEPAMMHLVQSLDPQEVTGIVAQLYGVPCEELLRRRGPHREARRLLMYLVAVHCRRRCALSELARLLSVTVGGLCTARARMERDLAGQGNPALRRRVEQALAAIRLQPACRSAPDSEATS